MADEIDGEILTLTDGAREKITEIQESQNRLDTAVRVTVTEEGVAAWKYDLRLVSQDEKSEDDEVVDAAGVMVYLDKETVPRLQGATLDFVSGMSSSGFKFENPNQPPAASDPLVMRVQKVIEDRINPGVASHGGSITLLGVKDGNVYIRMGGGCQGCGMADVTLKQGIEETLKAEIPEIIAVLDSTDHGSGSNPYYQAGK
ncbi:MAG: iron-sulfur cluster assembly accessory protein [Deltaproteobacteria bacterium]|nr:iron-sulfur cluster assembly accessory protein [Deltaproteobacteria bacterium]